MSGGTGAQTRTESDFLGAREIPPGAYWGVHTARALENFAVSGVSVSVHPALISALGVVKQACARANHDLGLIDQFIADAIDQACDDVREGRLNDQFVVDVIQGGAGTSTNMNANEVIANRALEILGAPLGGYTLIHPNDHVNRSQSTNDVYPSALKLALITSLGGLSASVDGLVRGLRAKGIEFADIPKVGRTQLQDAVPMTVGQEFNGWASTVHEEVARIDEASRLLRELNIGATAIGTGITTVPGYRAAVLEHLIDLTALELVAPEDFIEATSDTGSFVHLSATLKRLAVKVSKICNDLRLLSSGPQAGLGELRLPARQAGSSIMPGKVNPVIPEMVNQVAFAVVGNDVAITMAAEAGQLQLNAFEPLMGHLLLQDISWLTGALSCLTTLCIDGIQVNLEHLSTSFARSVGVLTALTPWLGYALSSDIAKRALAGEGEIRALVLATGLLDHEHLDELLRPEHLTHVANLDEAILGHSVQQSSVRVPGRTSASASET